MTTSVLNPQMETFTISVPKADLKRFKGIAKLMGWAFEEYYESSRFYNDIDEAERAIANGEGKRVCSVEELEAMFV